jgi:hypothetical protein
MTLAAAALTGSLADRAVLLSFSRKKYDETGQGGVRGVQPPSRPLFAIYTETVDEDCHGGIGIDCGVLK